MNDTHTQRFVEYRYVLLAALGALLYLVPLNLRELWYPGEPDMAQVCQAMFRGGGWIAPLRNGEYWVDYPPMMYWAACLASLPGGEVTAFTLRLPMALSSIALGLATCAAGSRWFGPRAGFWSGFALMTFVEFVYEAINYRPDPLFTAFIGAGVLLYASGAGEQRRWGPRVLGFACFGLAILTKGPLGLLLPGMVFGLWHGARREWRRFFELVPLALVAIAVALPWHLACAKVMGADVFWSDIWNQNFGRYGDGSKGHRRPMYRYAATIWADLAVWSVFLPFALFAALRGETRRDRHVQLALWWLFSLFVFFSLAETKRQLYLLPAYPAAALLVGRWIASLREGNRSRGPRAVAWGVAVLFAGIGGACLGAAAGFDPLVARLELDPVGLEVAGRLPGRVALLGGVTLLAGLWVGAACLWRGVSTAMVRIGAAHVALLAVVTSLVMPPLEPGKTYAPQCRWIRDQIGSSTHVGFVNPWSGVRNMGAFGFYTEALMDFLETEDDIEAFFEEHPGSLVVVHGRSVPELRDGGTIDWDARVVREFVAAGDSYVVLGAPE